MRRILIYAALVTAAILVGACTQADTSQQVFDVGQCREPPQSALDVADDSSLVIQIEPTVVTAGQILTINIDVESEFLDRQPAEAEPPTLGDGTLWRCWDGDQWQPTHILTKSSRQGAEAVPWFLEGQPQVANTVEAWGAPIPGSYWIRVPPNMPPGTYQIAEPDWLAPADSFWEEFVVTDIKVIEED